MLIHEMAHALTAMGHSLRGDSLMNAKGTTGALEFTPMDEAVLLLNSHPQVETGSRFRTEYRDFFCQRDC